MEGKISGNAVTCICAVARLNVFQVWEASAHCSAFDVPALQNLYLEGMLTVVGIERKDFAAQMPPVSVSPEVAQGCLLSFKAVAGRWR